MYINLHTRLHTYAQTYQPTNTFSQRISAYYPERAGKIFLINGPSVFSKCWALIKPMLDSVTQQKVGLYSAQDDYRSAMSEVFIGCCVSLCV